MNTFSDMASKSTKTKKDTKAKKAESSMEEEIITIELQYLLTPLAILVSALIISATIFFSFKKFGGGIVSGTSDTTVTDTVADDTVAEEEFVAVTTSIDDDPVLGDKSKAKVAIVEFSDFECPYCQQHFLQTHADLVEKYVDTGDVIIVYRDLPLSFHPSAEPAAIAANCVRDQKGDTGFFTFHDALFTEGLTDTDQLLGFAKEAGVNVSEYEACVASDKFDDEIANDMDDAAAAGVSGTPGFVIGVLNDDGTVDGVRVGGAYPLATFEQLIDEQLDRV